MKKIMFLVLLVAIAGTTGCSLRFELLPDAVYTNGINVEEREPVYGYSSSYVHSYYYSYDYTVRNNHRRVRWHR
jgi:hypothetical protein